MPSQEYYGKEIDSSRKTGMTKSSYMFNNYSNFSLVNY